MTKFVNTQVAKDLNWMLEHGELTENEYVRDYTNAEREFEKAQKLKQKKRQMKKMLR